MCPLCFDDVDATETLPVPFRTLECTASTGIAGEKNAPLSDSQPTGGFGVECSQTASKIRQQNEGALLHNRSTGPSSQCSPERVPCSKLSLKKRKRGVLESGGGFSTLVETSSTTARLSVNGIGDEAVAVAGRKRKGVRVIRFYSPLAYRGPEGPQSLRVFISNT